MRDRYLDVFLTKEDYTLRDAVRGLVDKEIIPVRRQVDDDKDHVIINRVLQALCDFGIQKLTLPTEYGGLGCHSFVTLAVLHEELGRGDGGIAAAATVGNGAWLPALMADNRVVLDRFVPEFCGKELKLACFAMTEPGGAGGGGGCDIENPRFHGRMIKTRAVLDGDEWVINGQKMWGSNSGIADLYCVLCTTDPDLGDEGIALIYVPKGTRGLTFGKDENKAGMAAEVNQPMFLENVRVPKEWRAKGPGFDGSVFHEYVAGGRIATAALAVGLAQAAFDIVLKYTGDRVVGGKPIRQHSIAAGILADMAIGIETARWSYLAAAHMFDHPETYGPHNSNFMLSRGSAVKIHACDVAVSVTNKAMELMGSYGYVRDYDVEKIWRDCKIIQLWEGGGQLGRLDVCRGYYDLEL